MKKYEMFKASQKAAVTTCAVVLLTVASTSLPTVKALTPVKCYDAGSTNGGGQGFTCGGEDMFAPCTPLYTSDPQQGAFDKSGAYSDPKICGQQRVNKPGGKTGTLAKILGYIAYYFVIWLNEPCGAWNNVFPLKADECCCLNDT
jgi:hypothetical protein